MTRKKYSETRLLRALNGNEKRYVLNKGRFYPKQRVYLLSASRALCHVMFFFLGSTLNSGPHARTKHSTQSGVPSLSSCSFFFFLFFLFANLPFSVERYGCLCVRASSCWWKKIWLPNVMCFCGRHGISPWRTHVWEGMRKSTKRIVHVSFRTPSVARVYAFGVFLSSLLSLWGLRRSAFLFQLFFWVRSNRKDTRAWSETTPKAWLRNLNT